MRKQYKVKLSRHDLMGNGIYSVIEHTTIYGERTSAYDSEPDTHTEKEVFEGGLADCNAFINLVKKGYMI